MTAFTQTLSNEQLYPGQRFALISSENGLYRLWNEQGAPGAQEVLTMDLSSWRVFNAQTPSDGVDNI